MVGERNGMQMVVNVEDYLRDPVELFLDGRPAWAHKIISETARSVVIELSRGDDPDEAKREVFKLLRRYSSHCSESGSRDTNSFAREYRIAHVASRKIPWAVPEVRGFVEECDVIARIGWCSYEVDLGSGILMEYVDGKNLFDHFNKSQYGNVSFTYEQALVLMYFAACAVRDFHDLGFVHRDIKPTNFLHTTSGTGLHLIDFGLATEEGFDEFSADCDIVGTPGYLSPESLSGQKPSACATQSSDLFALGATFYYLYGTAQVTRTTLSQNTDFVEEIKRNGLAFPSEKKKSPLVPVLKKMMAYKPENRYASAAELVADLSALIDQALQKKSPLSGASKRAIVKTTG